MIRTLTIALMALASPAMTHDREPPANEGYCIGVSPQNCPYPWTEDQGRRTYNPWKDERGESLPAPRPRRPDQRRHKL